MADEPTDYLLTPDTLQQWCQEAEASGSAALQAYAARLKGYSLSAA